jgi:hypothetical protein
MPIISRTNPFRGTRQPHPHRLDRLICGTNRHFMIHAIDPPCPARFGPALNPRIRSRRPRAFRGHDKRRM